MAAAVRVSITSVQASSVENTSGITHTSLHSCVMSPSEPSGRDLPRSQGAPVEVGDHSTSPALAPSCRCCSVPVSPWRFKHLSPARSAPGSAAEGRGSTASCRHRVSGTLTGAVETGMEQHPRTWSRGANPHLAPAPRTSSQRLRTSGVFGAWEEHRHSRSLPLPELDPESVPGLPQPSGCSGQTSRSSDPAKVIQKLQELGRDSCTMGTAWRGLQGSQPRARAVH